MKQILILFATREGQTKKIATQIADHLREWGEAVQLVDAHDTVAVRQLNIDLFDVLVFGGSMHAGGIEDELVGFINDQQAQILNKRRSFFLVLLSAAAKDPALRRSWLDDARSKMDQQLDVAFDDVEMIAGALRYSKYSTPLKWIMKRIASKAGEGTDTTRDYEYTNWDQVETYSRKLTDRE